MAGSKSDGAFRQMHQLLDFGAAGPLPDEQLLDRFVSRRDEAAEAAFEELVIRHGPMVLRVCRGVLHNAADVDEAFQAVFLVLANRAGAIRRSGSVASWLFGVARRVATRVKRGAARQQRLNRLVAERTPVSDRREEDDPDWGILHEEIDRLPERLRAPVVLCYLRGMTYEVAARQLGLSETAIRGRLARARERLRRCLTRRGVTIPAGLVVAGAAGRAQAAVPPALIHSTTRIALGFMACHTATILARGVVKSILLHQLRVATVLLALGLGGGLWAWHASAPSAAGQLSAPSAKASPPAQAPPALAGDEKAIPQDLARIERRRRERLEWNRRTVGGAYERIGKKDRRWDEAARKAMDLAARMFSEEVDPEVTTHDVHGPAKAAIDAGCDDPLLVYLHTRSLIGPDYPGEAEMIRRMRPVAEALAASRYPAFRRAIALEVAGTYTLAAKDLDEAARKRAERHFDSALALLPESVATDERNEFFEDRWLNVLYEVITGYRKLGVVAPAAYERVDARLAKLQGLDVLRLHLRGKFWFLYGSEARTTAFAPDVPAGGFERLEERLGIARRALEEACRLRPDDAWVATDLLAIDKAIGGDRATMERWFDRAMRGNGDNYNACQTKLDWVDPKWHGTDEEMLAFGRACRATGNWRAGITLLFADAHWRHACALGQTGRFQYLGRPDVWEPIRGVYEEYLAHRPRRHEVRSQYAALAYLGGRYREAHAQFERLGEGLTPWPAAPYLSLETLERIRDDAAHKVASGAR